MSLSKQVKARIRWNRAHRGIMAWKRKLNTLAGIVSMSHSLRMNSSYGARGITRVSDESYAASAHARTEAARLIKTTTHHSQVKDTLAKLREML